MNQILHSTLAQVIHADNINAGWWTNIATGTNGAKVFIRGDWFHPDDAERGRVNYRDYDDGEGPWFVEAASGLIEFGSFKIPLRNVAETDDA